VEDDGGHAGHLPGGPAHPHADVHRLRHIEERTQFSEVGDEVGENAGGWLAAVAVPVRLGGVFEVGEVCGALDGEGLVDGLACGWPPR
jgi:hypothetical protein